MTQVIVPAIKEASEKDNWRGWVVIGSVPDQYRFDLGVGIDRDNNNDPMDDAECVITMDAHSLAKLAVEAAMFLTDTQVAWIITHLQSRLHRRMEGES